MSAYERYAPFIQDYIYRQGWQTLRQVQNEAAEAIFDSREHVIIASGTASGKTEAAFFPILSLLEKDPPQSIGVLYIGPLKALINDQFHRLDELLADHQVPVWPWHGDVSSSRKEKALSVNRGILQITPESLEAMLMNHPGEARRLFGDLRFIVIDEIHAFMNEDRGRQVQCLLSRLERLVRRSPRRIGLSATLHEYESAANWLKAGTKREVKLAGLDTGQRRLSLAVRAYDVPADPDAAAPILQEMDAALYHTVDRWKTLIFTNTRVEAENTAARLKEVAKENGAPDIFHVHHGSIAAALRRDTERRLKTTTGPASAVATTTLELGIDIGDLDRIVQIGPPQSCSSFVQRLGRSGRRTGRSVMLFVEPRYEKEGLSLLEEMPWDLLRTLATVQLYLEERWVEPGQTKAKPFSLAVHQTLSILMGSDGLSPADLARQVLTLPPFKHTISQDEYRRLLRYLLEKDIIQRMEDGQLIPGLSGERLASHYTFYSVFKGEEEWQVRTHEETIGSLPEPPNEGETFVLAGRTWKALMVDQERRTVFVQEDHSQDPPHWSGEGAEVAERVVQKMREILKSDEEYKYLDKEALRQLKKARQLARRKGILDHPVQEIEPGRLLIAPWTGTAKLRALGRLLENGAARDLLNLRVYASRFTMEVRTALPLAEWQEGLALLPFDFKDPATWLPADAVPQPDAYDYLVPRDLLREAFAWRQPDISGLLETLETAK